MNRNLQIVLAAAIVLAGVWAARLAWLAHRDIVTLHVRNASLGAVTRSLERQTWETIIADGRLDTKVTLDVDDAPLTEVLERLGDQAGALVTTLHAVYATDAGLDKLRIAARAGAVAKASGWTNLVPNLHIQENDDAAPPPPPPDALSGGPGEPGGRPMVTMDRRVVVRGGPGMRPPMGMSGGADVMRVGRTGPDGAMGFIEEVVAPVRVMMESTLSPQLDSKTRVAPDESSALAVARQTGGKLVTWHVLLKSALGGLPPRLPDGFHLRESGGKPGSEPKQSREDMAARMEAEARRNDLARYRNLTPEQRVERLRGRQGPPLRP
jgi:hypothetical protein